MSTERFIPKSLYAMLDHILDQAEQWADKGDKDLDNKFLNRAWGAATAIADVKMDQAHWQRLNALRDRLVKSWKRLSERPRPYRYNLGAFDDDPYDMDLMDGMPGDPHDYGDN